MRIFEYGLIPESGYQGSYERKLKHYKLKHGTVADLLHDSMRLYDPDFDKRIPTLEEMNELLESGYFTRTAEWEPFSIDMEEYEEVVLVETADTYIDALASMKKHLEEFGQKIVRSSEKCDLPKGVTVRKQDSHFTQMINSYKGSSDMAIMFYEVNDEYGCFSNFSKHSFELEGEKWATSEIYFQAKKFEGTEYEETESSR